MDRRIGKRTDAFESVVRSYGKLRHILDRTTLYVDRHGAPDLHQDHRLFAMATALENASAQIALTSQALGYLCFGKQEGQFDQQRMTSSRVLARRADTIAGLSTNKGPRRDADLDYRVQLALEWIRMQPSRGNGETVVKAMEFQRAHVANVQSAEEAKSLLGELECREHGQVHRDRRRSLRFTLTQTTGDIRHRVVSIILVYC
jgi:hypothetical protein